MRNNIILWVLVLSMTFVSQSIAQSGSRSAGSGTRERQPSRVELARLAEQRRQEGLRRAKLQTRFEREQFKQTLVKLSLRENRLANSRRKREALREAVRDFKSLRSERLTPDQIGVLQVPFRLTDSEVDRSNGTVQWPEALQQFSELTESLDATVADGINSVESAKQFFTDLEKLNTAVNQAVVNREIEPSSYATARRFVTGLANEVRATDFGDVVHRV